MEVKIFTKVLMPKLGFWSSLPAATDSGLESEMNRWLAANPNIELVNITQSQSGGSWRPVTVVVSIWYIVK